MGPEVNDLNILFFMDSTPHLPRLVGSVLLITLALLLFLRLLCLSLWMSLLLLLLMTTRCHCWGTSVLADASSKNPGVCLTSSVPGTRDSSSEGGSAVAPSPLVKFRALPAGFQALWCRL